MGVIANSLVRESDGVTVAIAHRNADGTGRLVKTSDAFGVRTEIDLPSFTEAMDRIRALHASQPRRFSIVNNTHCTH